MRTMIVTFCLIFTFYGHSSTIYLTRHYEKTKQPEPSLTVDGKKRAEALARYLSDKSLQQIYSTSYKRTLETSTPLSENIGVNITVYAADDLISLANKVRGTDHNLIIVGHSNTTPELIELLGGPSVTIKESDYGTLYELTIDDAGTTMTETVISP